MLLKSCVRKGAWTAVWQLTAWQLTLVEGAAGAIKLAHMWFAEAVGVRFQPPRPQGLQDPMGLSIWLLFCVTAGPQLLGLHNDIIIANGLLMPIPEYLERTIPAKQNLKVLNQLPWVLLLLLLR